VAPTHWHALEDDQVIGRGEASRRPDGRVFLSIDAWQSADFDRLAKAMLAELPTPLHTVVDEADEDLVAQWHRAGFTVRRREWDVLLDSGIKVQPAPPAEVTILGVGRADEARLRDLDRIIRAEVEATIGWQEMPAELLGTAMINPAKYAVAERAGEYVGFVRVTNVARRPRIGLIAVRSDHRRQGIASALLAHVLNSLHAIGIATASAELNERNEPATALFDRFGARRAASNLEMVIA
jgi:ribosomal protein S18 acetylase RimI-like enzyme